MDRREMLLGLGATGMVLAAGTEMQAQTGSGGDETVYELRVYHLNPGKLPLILERFRTKETALFVKAGMHPIAYWTPTEGALAGDKIIYIVRHKSREAAKESWAKFQADPEWKVVKAESEKDGAFVAQHDITFMKLTDFSPKL